MINTFTKVFKKNKKGFRPKNSYVLHKAYASSNTYNYYFSKHNDI